MTHKGNTYCLPTSLGLSSTSDLLRSLYRWLLQEPRHKYASMQRCNPSSALSVALLPSSGHPCTACHRKRCGLLQSALAASHVARRLLRDRGVTMLVRVDVSGGAGGVLLVSLSHQAAGFAPYRLDNCSCETLHLRCAARAALGS